MKNQKIEAGLNRAIEQLTPDIYENVATAPIRKMQAHDHITSQTKAAKPSYRLQLATVFALFAVVVGTFIGWTQLFQAYGVVDLDVNPSIELTINRQNRVIDAEPLNLDGVQILNGMNLKFVKLENAVDAILGSMILNGYLTSQEDAMLVTVLMNEPTKAEEVKNTVVIRANQFFSSDTKPVIYSQSLSNTPEISSKAANYQVSRGVMNLINIILKNDTNYTVEQLIEMPVKQLYELAYLDDEKQDTQDDIDDQDDDRDDDLDDEDDVGNDGDQDGQDDMDDQDDDLYDDLDDQDDVGNDDDQDGQDDDLHDDLDDQDDNGIDDMNDDDDNVDLDDDDD